MPFRQRATSPSGVHTIEGRQLKLYTISRSGAAIPRALIDEALEHTAVCLRTDDLTIGERPADRLGFLILHVGEEAVWLIVNLWECDILRQHAYRAPLEEPESFAPAVRTGSVVCVWELEVVIHERRAWIEHVLDRDDTPDSAAYLRDLLKIRPEVSEVSIDPTAWVAPSATVVGDVTIGPGARIGHGARIVASGRGIEIGRCAIVLENAVIRSTPLFPATIGDHCLVGPNAHLVGCTLEDEVFVATSAAVFHGARLERGSEVRVNGTVHLRSTLNAGEVVPIGWIAVGDPTAVLPPDRHEEIWRRQEPLDFPMTAYGIERGDADMRTITARMSARMGPQTRDEPFS